MLLVDPKLEVTGRQLSLRKNVLRVSTGQSVITGNCRRASRGLGWEDGR